MQPGHFAKASDRCVRPAAYGAQKDAARIIVQRATAKGSAAPANVRKIANATTVTRKRLDSRPKVND
jgi:hypothetical protein